MPRVLLDNGHRLHYEVHDYVDPWLTPEAVVLHHGLGKSGRFWLPWARLLSRHFRVVTVDMLGCGRSSHPVGHPWSIADHAANAVALFDALGTERVHFVGEAVGGCVGLQLGARHGDRLHTLTLCSTPFRPTAGPVDLREKSEEISHGGLAGLTAAVDRELPGRIEWDRYPPGMYAWYRAQRLDASPRIVAEHHAAQAREDLEWTLPEITAPTLLIIPDESPVGATGQMQQMARVIPNAQVAALSDRRRPVWYHFAEADECVAAFLDFVAGSPAHAGEHAHEHEQEV